MLYSDPSGPILRICDQINQQSLHPDQQTGPLLPDPTFSGSVTNVVQPHNTFQTIPLVQQQQQQQLPQQPFSSILIIDSFSCLSHQFTCNYFKIQMKF